MEDNKQTRMETGEPYIVNLDVCNEALPEEQKRLGLTINQSNLCSEITNKNSINFIFKSKYGE